MARPSRGYRRRLLIERQRKTTPTWLNLLILVFILGTILFIWQPWLSPEERLLAGAQRFKEEFAQGVEQAAKEAEEARKAAERAQALWKRMGPGKAAFDDYLCGSAVRIVVYAASWAEAEEQLEPLKRAAKDTAKWCDKDSPLSYIHAIRRLNPGKSLKVPEPLFRALALYKRFSKELNGACDPTTGVLIELYGFGDPEKDSAYPSKEERTKVKPLVSADLLKLNRRDLSVQVKKSGVLVDWITVGRAVILDAVLRAAKEYGVENFVAFAGFDTVARGRRVNGEPWVFEVPHPQTPTFAKLGKLYPPADAALGAAVVSEKGRKIKKYWLHPFIHPYSLLPGRKSLQAWVVAKNPIEAVVAARCAFLAGAKKAKPWLRKHRFDAMIAPTEGDLVFVGKFSRYFVRRERSIFEDED